jgi:hypothetical protein
MQIKASAVLHAVKESKGEFEGRAFSSTTFHLEVELPENGAGRSIGKVTRPFKFGDAGEFDKWAHLGNGLPLNCDAVFDIAAGKDNETRLVLAGLSPAKKAA